MGTAMDIPTIIKRLRKRGLSQSAISRETGIPQPRLSRWERGLSIPPSFNDLSKLIELDEKRSREAA